MAAEKLSVSFDFELAATIRAAAAEEGVSVSTCLARAAEAKARQRALRHDHGSCSRRPDVVRP